ncbi:MAG: nucleoid occlusion factor SlmA [Pseudomonadales bacterium]|nr:nucleoid occlusion factor SlmA [Pseudomonadales bacterium]
MTKVNRRQQILEALALMLQNNPGDRITTASLAKAVGVSEAALYRHFPSKAKMLEGLIAFAEDTLFSRINMILSEQPEAYDRCRNIIFLILSFVERNPGFARLFVGDALAGETERLRARMHQLMNRVETQLRLVLREHNARQPSLPSIQINAGANLLLAYTEGRILQFVRSNFDDPPTKEWENQWATISKALFDS